MEWIALAVYYVCLGIFVYWRKTVYMRQLSPVVQEDYGNYKSSDNLRR